MSLNNYIISGSRGSGINFFTSLLTDNVLYSKASNEYAACRISAPVFVYNNTTFNIHKFSSSDVDICHDNKVESSISLFYEPYDYYYLIKMWFIKKRIYYHFSYPFDIQDQFKNILDINLDYNNLKEYYKFISAYDNVHILAPAILGYFTSTNTFHYNGLSDYIEKDWIRLREYFFKESKPFDNGDIVINCSQVMRKDYSTIPKFMKDYIPRIERYYELNEELLTQTRQVFNIKLED